MLKCPAPFCGPVASWPVSWELIQLFLFAFLGMKMQWPFWQQLHCKRRGNFVGCCLQRTYSYFGSLLTSSARDHLHSKHLTTLTGASEHGCDIPRQVLAIPVWIVIGGIVYPVEMQREIDAPCPQADHRFFFIIDRSGYSSLVELTVALVDVAFISISFLRCSSLCFALIRMI